MQLLLPRYRLTADAGEALDKYWREGRQDETLSPMLVLYSAAGIRGLLLNTLSETIRTSLKPVMKATFQETIFTSNKNHRIISGTPEYVDLLTYRDEDSAHFWFRYPRIDRQMSNIEHRYGNVWDLCRRTADRVLVDFALLERAGVLPPPPQVTSMSQPFTYEELVRLLGPPAG
jgi:hypothetical protein